MPNASTQLPGISIHQLEMHKVKYVYICIGIMEYRGHTCPRYLQYFELFLFPNYVPPLEGVYHIIFICCPPRNLVASDTYYPSQILLEYHFVLISNSDGISFLLSFNFISFNFVFLSWQYHMYVDMCYTHTFINHFTVSSPSKYISLCTRIDSRRYVTLPFYYANLSQYL